MSDTNLYSVLHSGFSARLDAVAIQTPQRNYTFHDIDAGSGRVAAWLASLRLPAGSRVAVQVEKSPEALMLYLGTLRAG